MLRLLPIDIVNYIYEIVHKSNTQYIVNEYIHKINIITRNNMNEDNCFLICSNVCHTLYNERILRYITLKQPLYDVRNRKEVTCEIFLMGVWGTRSDRVKCFSTSQVTPLGNMR